MHFLFVLWLDPLIHCVFCTITTLCHLGCWLHIQLCFVCCLQVPLVTQGAQMTTQHLVSSTDHRTIVLNVDWVSIPLLFFSRCQALN